MDILADATVQGFSHRSLRLLAQLCRPGMSAATAGIGREADVLRSGADGSV
jgi:hypothetical protein